MSKFSLIMESADSTDNLGSAAAAEPNNLQISDAGLQAAAVESFEEMQAEGKGVDELGEAQDKVLDIKDVVTEAAYDQGLSPLALKYLNVSLRNIVGKSHTNKRLPSMEAAEKNDPVLVARIALEGIKDTISQFWTAIKNQATKFWNMTKNWYIKTLDGSNKIIARAKALEEASGNTQGSATEKSFEMGGAGLLAVNYQVKDPNSLITGLGELKKVLDQNLLYVKNSNSSEKAEEVVGGVKEILTALRKVKTGIAHNSDPNNTSIPDINPPEVADKLNKAAELHKKLTDDQLKDNYTFLSAGQDDELLKLYQAGNVDIVVLRSQNLPGNRNVFTSLNGKNTPLPKDVEGFTNFFKSIRSVLGATSAKPKEMDDNSDVKTLNPSQVGNIASLCLEMGEATLEYKKEFEARDKYFNTLIKGFDNIMKELEGQNVTFESFNGFAMEAIVQGGTNPNGGGNINTPVTNAAQQAQAANQAKMSNAAAAQNTVQGNNQNASTTTGAGQAGGSQTQTGTGGNQQQNQQQQAIEAKADDKVDKEIRKLSQAWLGLFKKDISLSGALITHSMKVCNVYLSYGEKSLAQYK